jgi:hypothetical protein
LQAIAHADNIVKVTALHMPVTDTSMYNTTLDTSYSQKIHKLSNISLLQSTVGKTVVGKALLVNRYHSFELSLHFLLISQELVNMKHMLSCLNPTEVGGFDTITGLSGAFKISHTHTSPGLGQLHCSKSKDRSCY